MSQELLYTSAPQGLKPGSRGFCTVVSTADMTNNLAERLESLSGYEHAFETHDSRSDRNPVNFRHVIATLSGSKLHILSRICNAGLDYTKRSNKLAHHIVLDPSEASSATGGPARLMMSDDFFETTWDGETKILPAGRLFSTPASPTTVCFHWQRITAGDNHAGDAGWAGVLAENATVRGAKPMFVIYPVGSEPLPLVMEALSLLPRAHRWQVSFSTYFTKLPAGLECQWRFILDGSPEASALRHNPVAQVIDLCKLVGDAPESELVLAARQGIAPKSPESVRKVTAQTALTQNLGERQGLAAPPPHDGSGLTLLSDVTPGDVSLAETPPHDGGGVTSPPPPLADASELPPLPLESGVNTTSGSERELIPNVALRIKQNGKQKQNFARDMAKIGLAAWAGLVGLTVCYLVMAFMFPQIDFLHLLNESTTVAQQGENTIPSISGPPIPAPVYRKPNDTSGASKKLALAENAKEETPDSSTKTSDKIETKEQKLERFFTQRDSAVRSGDLPVAFAAVDEIAKLQGGDAYQLKADIIIALEKGAHSPGGFKRVAQGLLAILDRAVDERQNDFAKNHVDRMLLAARKSKDSNLVNRVTLCVLRVQNPEKRFNLRGEKPRGNLRQASPAIRPRNAPALAVAPFPAALAIRYQEEWANYLGVEVETTNSVGIKMRLLPPGQFLMGSSKEEPRRLWKEEPDKMWTEVPQHHVTLTKPFSLSAFEVTRGQFRQFVEATLYKTDAEKDGKGGKGWKDGKWVRSPEFLWNTELGFESEQTDEHPVVNVSWNDAVAFCQWLSEKEGITYRLPTEAEWEYACRAGTTTAYSFGDDDSLIQNYAWYEWRVRKNGRNTKPIGQKKPSSFGLYDMHGNVWEWCADRYGPYAKATAVDPVGPPQGKYRLFRGGAFTTLLPLVRSANRDFLKPSFSSLSLGFRLARTYPPIEGAVGELDGVRSEKLTAKMKAEKAAAKMVQIGSSPGGSISFRLSLPSAYSTFRIGVSLPLW